MKRNSRKSHHDYSKKRQLHNLRNLAVNNGLSDDDSDDGFNQQLDDHIANVGRLNEQLDDHQVQGEENIQEVRCIHERPEEFNRDQIDEANENELEDGRENELEDGSESEPKGGRENEPEDGSERESEGGRENAN
ncbi:uncharacterized protein LOC141525425 [Cotesia typhae]|uniref:uncharacterized protein LOC141525425 n=1 Tax=Cotesia typhae TaxID=2053667 RepID=UPI003D69B15A